MPYRETISLPRAGEPPITSEEKKQMDKFQYWKNFNLGVEVGISGRFIYNGLQCLHEMETLFFEEEIFEFLYNLAVGVERLAKIAVILLEHDTAIDQDEFDRSLITHSHQDLIERVKSKTSLSLAGPQNELLQLLGTFYKSHRYARYNSGSIQAKGREKTALHAYLQKYLGIEIKDEFPFNITPNDKKIKKFIGRTVEKLTSQLYEIIEGQARELNIYTYEIRYHSKAYKIFLMKKCDFFDEEILRNELFIYLANCSDPKGHLKYIKSLPPLSFDFASGVEHLGSFKSVQSRLSILEELESLYEDLDDVKARINAVSIIGLPDVYFDDEDDGVDEYYDEFDSD